tara:strand:- start:122 stop:532 length:411 start_codon:yes stop_codon:yes gene_type:complete
MAKDFKAQYTTYVIPLVNLDGFDNGHWRHNLGGVDLNRDWKDLNQPENSAIRDFLSHTLKASAGKYFFAIDFYSTWENMFYITNSNKESNMLGLISLSLDAVGKELVNYEPNIRPVPDTVGISSLPICSISIEQNH